jgi:hypothetical protein
VLLQHPDISDCAVSKLVRNGAEMPRAYVVRRSQMLSATDVADFSRQQLVSYKALTGGVVLVKQIPKLASGKIQRYRLEEMPLDVDIKDSKTSRWRPWAWIARALQLLGDRKMAEMARNWLTGLFHGRLGVADKAMEAA